MAINSGGAWVPGIGDPTFVGWLTVVAYFGAAWSCWRRLTANDPHAQTQADGERQFWWLLTATLVFLGINKQLDLQTLLTEIGRNVARTGGWYERRQNVQMIFIGLIGTLGLASLAWLCWLSRPLSLERSLTLGGMTFLGCFVVIRAASFHHVDALIKTTVLGMRANWLLELGGIALVATGALLKPRHHDRQVRSMRGPRSRT